MSAILGIFDTRGDLPDPGSVSSMLACMRQRGAEHVQVWKDAAAAVAVARGGWEMEDGFSGGALVVADEDFVIAADASLYYIAELRRALESRGVRPAGNSPSHLILAAYRAWGHDCAAHLEGDFAFIVWDLRVRRVFCARDFGGKRELFYAVFRDTIVVASTIGGVLAHPRCPRDLNLTSIAEQAAGLFAGSAETSYRSVFSVPAAHSIEWNYSGNARISRHWDLPRSSSPMQPSFEAAAEELRALLSRASEERLDPAGSTAVWLSGGWDSTAVFGASADVLRQRGREGGLRAVSVSFPEGDPGREDDLISAVADRWSAPVYWIDIANVPMFHQSRENAARRDGPFAHAYESFNRALARGTRAKGSRVAFDGSGGDQLFSVSDVFLADLFSGGQWRTFVREWNAMGYPKGMKGGEMFIDRVVKPLTPWTLRRLIGLARGKQAVRAHYERAIPRWINPRFAKAHDLDGRERTNTPRREGDWTSYELQWFVSNAYFPRIFGAVFSLGLEDGVERRSPLYDRRVVEFAATRPREERYSGRETKRLLRRSMRGLLPDHVLAPRVTRTGVTSRYFERSMQAQFGTLFEQTENCARLAELGIVDQDMLVRTWESYRRGGARQSGVGLFLTLQAEMWLWAHDDHSTAAPSMLGRSRSRKLAIA